MTVRRIGIALAGTLGLLLFMEATLQALPVSSATARNYYIDPLILTYPPGHRWVSATGWDLRNSQALRANNLGFSSDIEFVPDPLAVGLIGDSFVEASMLDSTDRPDAQLAAALGNSRPVYAFGAPGSALLDYAERIRLASARLGMRDFVVMMEPGDVRQSLCRSGNVHGPCLDAETLQPHQEKLPPPSILKRILSRSALAQYVVGQLKLDAGKLPKQLFANSPPAPGAPPASLPNATPSVAALQEQSVRRQAMVQAVSEAFFSRIQPFATGRLVLVVNGPRTRDASASAAVSVNPINLERELFIEIARARGATVIDTTPVFSEHWRSSDLSLDVGPYDGHLNRLGVRLVMQAAAKALL